MAHKSLKVVRSDSRYKLYKWLNNSLVFSAPAIIVFLTALQSGKPMKEAVYVFYVYGLGILIDALKKVAIEEHHVE